MILAAILLGAFIACDTNQPANQGHGDGYTLYPKLAHVTGHIDRVDANPDNRRYFDLLVLTDANRRQWQFHSDGWVGVSVGHLKDHQIQGTTITVWYEQQPDRSLLARFVGD